jgi:hypothetical protein
MPKHGDDKNGQTGGSSAGPSTPSGAAVTPPAGGTTPPSQGNTTGTVPQQGGTPPAPPKNEGKKRVKCAALKGEKIIVGKGEVVQIDENGLFEVEAKEAERLLTIPDYEEA